ncbi:uncharacterized protein [Diabrotica undecimpunctata]|uniref:uncharacterized protein n=1 Tax=Diabrotica undecimpunctata TaxID=50387 RepID=UPI003B640C19
MSCKTRIGYDWPRNAATLLIELWEQHQCLYLPSHPQYHNRNVRVTALQTITKQFNNNKMTNLSEADVKKKLHSIRTQYMAELTKIKKSESSGAGVADIYVPKLWCFDELHFLQQGATIVSKGESNLPELSFSHSIQSQYHSEVDNSEGEMIFEGDVEEFSNLEVLSSPTVCRKIPEKTQSSSRASSSYEGQAPPKKNQKNKRRRKPMALLVRQ